MELGEGIQKELNTLVDVLEEIKHTIPEGHYLRGMNALGSIHKHKQTMLARPLRDDGLSGWQTLDEIMDENTDLYDEIMTVADQIIRELCGVQATIYTDSSHNLIHRGEEKEIFNKLIHYKPQEGNAGYETSPMILHHAIQVIMDRIFHDTYYELEIVRPVSCQCGWRGAQGNWDRHISNMRHQRWVNAELERTAQKRLDEARQMIVARREKGIVYLNELHFTPESKIATVEAIEEAEASGDRVVFISADGTLNSFT